MAARYGWIITRDVGFETYADGPNRVGRMGPHSIDPDIVARLMAGEGRAWRCYSDDLGSGDHLDYCGRYIGPDDESMFGPLWDFCEPDVGSTTIRYKNGNGPWEVL